MKQDKAPKSEAEGAMLILKSITLSLLKFGNTVQEFVTIVCILIDKSPSRVVSPTVPRWVVSILVFLKALVP